MIAAHNYRTHFGKLKGLETGDEVIFTDAAGNRFEYKVAAVEALTPQSVEDMTSGEWAVIFASWNHAFHARNQDYKKSHTVKSLQSGQ